MDPLSYLDEAIVWWLVTLSAVMFVGTLVAVPWMIARIPEDYFSRAKRSAPALLADRPTLRALLRAIANVLGMVLVLAGVVMLLLPGQGILTIVLGLLLINFPGKYRLERWLVSQSSVLSVINRMRRRAGRKPLQVEKLE